MRNRIVPTWANLEQDKFSPRSFKKTLRMTTLMNSKLKDSWKERVYPNPNDKNVDCNFVSEQDYLEYIVSRVIKMNKTKWLFFTHV